MGEIEERGHRSPVEEKHPLACISHVTIPTRVQVSRLRRALLSPHLPHKPVLKYLSVLPFSTALIRRPMLTQCATSFVLFGTGDILAQQAFEKKGSNHDVRPTSSFLHLILIRHGAHSGFARRGCHSTEVRRSHALPHTPHSAHPPSVVCPHVGAIFGPLLTKWLQLLNRLQFASPTKAVMYKVLPYILARPAHALMLRHPTGLPRPVCLHSRWVDYVFVPARAICPDACARRRGRPLLWREHAVGGKERQRRDGADIGGIRPYSHP